MDPDDHVIAELLDRCRRDHRAWISGDGSGYALPVEGSILGAVGGYGRGGPETLRRQLAVARRWRCGEGTVELVNGGRTAGLAWIVMIERATVEFAHDPTPRRWDLRVTEIFREIDGEWRRVHRHADPLVDLHDLAELADLLV